MRDLTVCDTLKACYLVNIKTRAEYTLSGNDIFEIDVDHEGYSIRCDVNHTESAESDFIKFKYDNMIHEEFGEPRYMHGDSGAGSYINKVEYLSTCGHKKIIVEGHVWSNLCFTENYNINLFNPDGTCDSSADSVPVLTTTPVLSPTEPVCNDVEACYIINLQTRVESLLDGDDTYFIDPTNNRGYSIRCDLLRAHSDNDVVKFIYDEIEQKEYGTTQSMNGDSYEGQYINPVPYLSTCGSKNIVVELMLGSKLCASREFVVNIAKTDGGCFTPIALPSAIEVPTPVPVLVPAPVTVPEVQVPVNAPIGLIKSNCDSLQKCVVVNINTRDEFPLEEYNMYVLDPTNTLGYSIRCDVAATLGKKTDYIKFSYDNTFKYEFGSPRFMNGDNDGGQYIYNVPYLSTCGLKRFTVEAAYDLDICFTKEFVIIVLDADGNCDAPIAPISAPVWTPTATTAPYVVPVTKPIDAPVIPPTKSPTRIPTNLPTISPTKLPTYLPTARPSISPTNPSFNCILPPAMNNFSIISIGDATIGASTMKKGISIGGTLFDGTPTESGTVDTTMSFIGDLDETASFYFNGGITLDEGLPLETYLQFIILATNAINSTFDDTYKVLVITQGGTYNTLDFVPESTGSDHGKTLLIFNTPDNVTLIPTSTGRPFGPSVIAPFSKVLIRSDIGYVEGFVVGKTVETVGRDQSSIMFIGNGYSGPLSCN